MTRIDMAKWKPTPPPRHVLAAAKEKARAAAALLAELEARAALENARPLSAVVTDIDTTPVEVPPEVDNNLHFEAIYKAVRDDFGVERETLEGKGRHPKVIAARRALVWLTRKRTLLSFPEICKAMGRTGRGHSTMVDQFHAAEAMMDQPMYPGTAETFAEYFFRFSQRAWAFKPRSPSVANPPAEQGK